MLRRASPRAGRGQSVVEFALSLPFLILLLAGVVDFANAYRIYIALTNSAREGAYALSVPDGSGASVCARVQESLAGSGISVGCADVSSVFPAVAGDPNCPGGSAKVGCPVRVSVSYAAPTFFAGILGLASVPLNASADMMVLSGT